MPQYLVRLDIAFPAPSRTDADALGRVLATACLLALERDTAHTTGESFSVTCQPAVVEGERGNDAPRGDDQRRRE